MANQTTDTAQSWLPDANDPTTDFPLTHLPYGTFTIEDQQHLCVAIGVLWLTDTLLNDGRYGRVIESAIMSLIGR